MVCVHVYIYIYIYIYIYTCTHTIRMNESSDISVYVDWLCFMAYQPL